MDSILAAVALFTKKGAELNVKVLKNNWNHYISRSWNEIKKMPKLDIIPVTIV